MISKHKKAPRFFLRRQSRKQQRQQHILAAAFKVFAAQGYEAARLDEVAKGAGIAKGTIYLYFRDKKQLFRAVVRSLLKKRFDAVAGAPGGSAEEQLRSLVSRMYAEIVSNARVRSIVRLLIAECGRFPEIADIYHREIIAPGMKAMRRVLAQGIAAGQFRETPAVQFPQILAAPGVLAIMWRMLHGEGHRLDLDAYKKAHLEFVLGSLRKKPV